MTFETMIGDVMDTFRNTTSTVNQMFVRSKKNRKIETSTYHRVSYWKIWCVNHVFSGYAILLPNLQEVWTFRKWKGSCQKRSHFWSLAPDDHYLMTSKNKLFLLLKRNNKLLWLIHNYCEKKTIIVDLRKFFQSPVLPLVRPIASFSLSGTRLPPNWQVSFFCGYRKDSEEVRWSWTICPSVEN